MTRYAVIVAGGSGSRYGGPVPKQFLSLAGVPVLMRSVELFAGCGARIIVVLPEAQTGYWADLCRERSFGVQHQVVTGGGSRFESVKNALAAIDALPGDIVAVHDGVRPLVPPAVIEDAYATAARSGSAVPVVPVTDSIRRTDGHGGSRAVPRERLVAVQTPQAFDAVALKQAYEAEFSPLFTDDASVMEASGRGVTLIAGSPGNIKITHPGDIAIAELILRDGTPR